MSKIRGIYGIQNNINNKIYIGKSIDIKGRFSHHKYQLKKEERHKDCNRYLFNSVKKYNISNFTFLILEEVKGTDEGELSNRELYWMDKYNSCNRDFGYNLRRDSSTKTIVHKDTRKLLSNLFSGKNNPNYGNNWSEEQKHNLSEKIKKEFKEGKRTVNWEGLSKGWKERSRRVEEVEGYREKMGKNVSDSKSKYDILKIDRDSLEILEEFNTFLELKEKYPNVGKTVIFSVCNGNKKSYRGFLWRYRCKKTKNIIEPVLTKNKVKKKVLNISTNEVFESITEAAKSISMDNKTLGAKLNGVNKNDTPFVFYSK